MQKSLSFNKGITTSPSDLLSDDTELSASRDLIFRNGEMQPLRQAKQFAQTNNRLLYIHKGADYTNAITYDGHDHLYCGTLSDNAITEDKGTFSVGMVYDISSVGNTLVVATSSGLHYILFKEGSYVDLGTELPTYRFDPQFPAATMDELGETMPCAMDGFVDVKYYKANYDSSGNFTSYSEGSAVALKYDFIGYTPKADAEKKDDLRNAIQGHVAARIARVKEKNFFAFPFFVRCALRLYDGSYARITAPIACYPTISRNCRFTPAFYNKDEGKYEETTGVLGFPVYFIYHIYYAPLQYRITEAKGFSDWKDIVKEFVVFASDDVIPFELEGKYSILLPNEITDKKFLNLIANPASVFGADSMSLTGEYKFTSSGYKPRSVIYPTYKSEKQIIDELVGKSQFFKIFSVDIGSANIVSSEDGYNTYIQPYIAPNVVSNLTSQEQLTVDDYYGWTKMIPQKVTTYNGRINMFGVKRKPFDGFPFLTCSGVGQSSDNTKRFIGYYVKINSTAKTCVKSPSPMSQRYPNTAVSWFFYPDPNAYEAVVYDGSGHAVTMPLKRHPMLNGAYAFPYLPTRDRLTSSGSTPTPTSSYEVLDSQIFTSVVNNPFVFQASGDNTVGTGSILGIAANTEPISQGQFGQYPLIVFTTEGIYGLSVNSEGLYSASYPISREVCNNPASITPTGNVVYFTSDKGLMAVSGGTVRCVSPQLSGANPPYSDATDSFLTFVRNAFLAYDYRDSLLFIYNVSYDYAYVYNLLDGTFATISLGNRIWRSVSNYPDTLLQDSDNNVYSFNKIPVAQSDSQTYSGTFTTRPLKLGSSIQLKTIHQIVHLFNSAGGTLKLTVWASNDCHSWNKLYSLHGKPWKYYRFRYNLTNISASDTFAGTVIDFTPRFTNKIR